MNSHRNLRLSFLDSFDLVDLHQPFLKAFSDYIVPMNLDRDQFKELLIRRGSAPSLSVAAFDGKDIVGFNINATGDYQGVSTVYDVATGIVPEYRRHGIARALFDFSLSKLISSGSRRYVLEVFQNNPRAFSLYKKVGFEVLRELLVFQSSALAETRRNTDFVIEQISPDWDKFRRFWDWSPSWQNSIESMQRSAAEKIIAGIFRQQKLIGYGIIFPANGDIAQFAIDQQHRKRGAGMSLITALQKMARRKATRVVNVDASAVTTIAFLQSCGFQLFATQYEMEMKLSSIVRDD
jgi:ribosomal protein S18 acetylase RimI-like enzyme